MGLVLGPVPLSALEAIRLTFYPVFEHSGKCRGVYCDADQTPRGLKAEIQGKG